PADVRDEDAGRNDVRAGRADRPLRRRSGLLEELPVEGREGDRGRRAAGREEVPRAPPARDLGRRKEERHPGWRPEAHGLAREARGKPDGGPASARPDDHETGLLNRVRSPLATLESCASL